VEQIATISMKASFAQQVKRHGKKLVATVAIGAVALLAGCSNVNAAATVGGDVITTTQVQNSVASILKLRATVDTSSLTLLKGADIARNVLNLHISELLLKQAAAAKNITATPEDIAKYKAALVQQIGGVNNLNSGLIQNSIAAEDFDTYATFMVLGGKITAALNTKTDTTSAQNYLTSFFTKVKITVNPRYGTWNQAKSQVEAGDATSGAVAAPTATPSK